MIKKIGNFFLNHTIIVVFIALTQISCSPHFGLLSSTESWVFNQIYNHNEVNMKDYSEDEKLRVLNGRFISSLLRDTVFKFPDLSEKARRKIYITNAIIKGGVYLEDDIVRFPIYFVNCRFESEFISNRVVFEKIFAFQNCSFNDEVDFERTTFDFLVIKDSNFTDPNFMIDFQGMIVNRDFIIIGTAFEGGVSFASIKVGGYFFGVNSKFNNKTKLVSFESMQVDASASFNNACFSGPVVGFAMQVNSQLQLEKAKFLGEKENVTFSHATVRDILLNDAEFKGRVSFNVSNIKGFCTANNAQFRSAANFRDATFGSLNIEDSNFTDPNSMIDFRDVIVIRDFSIIGTAFEGGVSFASIKVGGRFSGSNAKFNNKTKPVSFNGMQADASTYFNNACFSGPVNGLGMQINSQLQLEKAKFLSEKAKVEFSLANVRDILLNDAEFKGPVLFDGSNIKGFFTANKAQFCSTANFSDATFGSLSIEDSNFTDPNSNPSFTFMHVKGNFLVSRTNFSGGVNFTLSKIGDSFLCTDVNFNNKTNQAGFFGMQINNVASFNNVSFEGPVDGDGIQARYISLQASSFLSEDKTVSFSEIKASHSLSLRNAVFKGPVSFQGSSVGTVFSANDAQFVSESGLVDLRHMHVAGKVILSGAAFKGPIGLEGFSYDLIEIDEHEDSCEYMLKLADQANYSPDVYMTLEDYSLKQGNSKMADKIHVASKRRQRKISFSVGNWCRDFLFRYGRKTERVLFVVIFPMLIIGTVIFRPKYMVPVNEKGNYIKYHPFFYSLDLFLPLINIFWAKDWIPRKECTRLHIYMVVHTIIGWVSIPLALAAWMGIIN